MKYTHKLDNIGLPNFELHITTAKYGDNLVTSASVGKKDGYFFSVRIHQDYYRRWIISPCKRATAKAIQTQQDKALLDISAIVQDVEGHYTQRKEIAKPD